MIRRSGNPRESDRLDVLFFPRWRRKRRVQDNCCWYVPLNFKGCRDSSNQIQNLVSHGKFLIYPWKVFNLSLKTSIKYDFGKIDKLGSEILSNSTIFSRDEFELEFFRLKRARAVKFPSRAELGHFNFRDETKLTILTICMSKNSKFLTYFPILLQYHDSNQFYVHLHEYM